MTDKEFKRLSRAQLIDVIYQFQLQIDKLTEQNQELEQKLEDRRFRLSNAGNIADAALEINNCFRSAQDAAEQYLNEIKAIREETEAERCKILSEAQAEAAAIIADAQAEAALIIADAKKKQSNYDSKIKEFLIKFGQRHSDNGDENDTQKER